MKNKVIAGSIVLLVICGVIGIVYNNHTQIQEEKQETNKQINKVKSDEKANAKDGQSLSDVSNDEETVKLSNDSGRKNQTTTSADDSNNDNEIKKSTGSSDSNKETAKTPNNSISNKKEGKSLKNSNNNKETTSISNSSSSTDNNETSNELNELNGSKDPDDAYTGGVDWDKVGEEFEHAEWNHVGSGEIDPGGNTYDQWESK